LNVYLQVRQHFELQEDTIVKGKYILIKKPMKNKSGVALPICTKERIYVTECFVKQCKINVENEACKKLIAAKPIIATKFMTRVIHMEDEIYKYICHARDHFTKWSWAAPLKQKGQGGCQSPPKNIFKFWPTDFITHGQWQ
jgi:hypothetical protein